MELASPIDEGIAHTIVFELLEDEQACEAFHARDGAFVDLGKSELKTT